MAFEISMLRIQCTNDIFGTKLVLPNKLDWEVSNSELTYFEKWIN